MHADLPASVFASRRQALMAQLPAESAVIIFAAKETTRNNDVHYPFRQDSYFWYYTGFPEADAVLVIQAKNGNPAHTTLYSAERNPLKEIWEGRIIGQTDAVQEYGFDCAYPLSDVGQISKILANPKHLYTVLGISEHNDQRAFSLLRELHQANGRGGAETSGVLDLRRVADEMRLIKDQHERALLHKAGQISAQGHCAAMLAAPQATHEYHLQAAIEASYRQQAGAEWSFPTIVAGGANACCLHYRANNQPLRDGELVLIDSGAEYAGYAGDISRTFPKNGKFSRDQQALYEVVLNAQESAIAASKPNISHEAIHEITARVIAQGLLDLKIIRGSVEDWLAENRIKQFFPHGTGHWLGLDVHDVGVYKPNGASRLYQSGMVITIEPGIYIQPDDTSVEEKWRGMGIRIEDDVIITDTGHELTSNEVPKKPQEIEAFMHSSFIHTT